VSQPRVAVYARLSQDRDGAKDSTARQIADCRALAKGRGWRVVEVFEDRDRSAYNGNVRPEFDRMVAAVKAGTVSGIVAWRVDRIGRRTAEVVDLVDRLRRAGGFIATCDGLDTASPTGKAVMQVGAIFAELESDNTSARTRRAKLQRAAEGRPSGGGRRPFGYTADGLALVDDEAALIRDAATAILAGSSLRGVVARWNADGVLTSQGRQWVPASLRRVLTSARIAGLRSHHGEVTAEAVWPRIVDRETHERLRAVLLDPRRRTSLPAARRYELTGLAVCGRCSAPLVAAPLPRGRTYACRSQQRAGLDGERACGGVRILAEELEAEIRERVLIRLDTPRVQRARSKDDPTAKLARSLEADEEALERLVHDHYVSRVIDARSFASAQAELRRRIDGTRAELTRTLGAGTLAALPRIDELRRTWDDLDLDRRRAVLAALIERIDVAPVGRGQRSVDHPERITVRWRA
jgi:DNA invertase Pin-like site-specific DNA recombinase